MKTKEESTYIHFSNIDSIKLIKWRTTSKTNLCSTEIALLNDSRHFNQSLFYGPNQLILA